MTGKERIEEKLVELTGYLSELQAQQNLTRVEFQQNGIVRRGVERILQIAVECLLDIGNMLIAANRWRAPESNREVFQVLAEQELLPAEKLPRYEKMAGFRNILVHEYTRVDPTIVYALLQTGLPDFVAFMEAVAAFLRRGERRDEAPQ